MIEPSRSEKCVPSCVNVTCVTWTRKTRNSSVCRRCVNIRTWWKLCWHNAWIRASYVFFFVDVTHFTVTYVSILFRVRDLFWFTHHRAVGSPYLEHSWEYVFVLILSIMVRGCAKYDNDNLVLTMMRIQCMAFYDMVLRLKNFCFPSNIVTFMLILEPHCIFICKHSLIWFDPQIQTTAHLLE